jgi:acetolactate synthase-1/2/3 large subunit
MVDYKQNLRGEAYHCLARAGKTGTSQFCGLQEAPMKVADAVAYILKAEGVEYLFAYPVNPLIEAAAKVGIRPIIIRQERTGLHMADAFSRVTSGEKIGVFCMQQGPGTENAFGGVAQAYSESVPMVVLPAGYTRTLTNVTPNFNAFLNFQHVTKSCEQVILPQVVPDALRRAFTQARNGRPRPALVEIPADLFNEDIPEPAAYRPSQVWRSAPDPAAVAEVADVLLAARRPVIYAGQGVHYAQAWGALRELAERLSIPVTTSLEGKSAFPETHPLSLGSGGRSLPKAVYDFLHNADVILGIGCSFSSTGFGVKMPLGKTIIHATLDPLDINKDLPASYALVGDARLTLEALLQTVEARLNGRAHGDAKTVAQEIEGIKADWLARWQPKLTSEDTPLSPYRVIWDLMHTVDVANTIITHDAGSPRDQLSPFWESVTPLSYIGWGKTTQLGYGLGLAMGAKLAHPDRLCINFRGDAAIGFTGMDFETAVRERIPILSVLMNNFSMAIEIPIMPVSTERYRSTDISGHYADFAAALGGYGERVMTPDQIIPAIQRGIEKTQAGVPTLLEFITAKETEVSLF